ncbi:MAG: tryptophan 2,3-dioxygenase family protein, partial [Pseudomonadota bacterium]
MSKQPYDPGTDGAKMTFHDAMSYGDYLKIDTILAEQHPRSDAHDELLFIIQHQTSELWMKLIIHEMNAARAALKSGDNAKMFKMLARVSRIFEQLNNQWDVLRTMTPADYTRFRETLGPSSGLQSYQYRMIEFVLGNRNRNMLKPHLHVPHVYQMLKEEIARPSLYDEAVAILFQSLDGSRSEMPAPQLDTPHEAKPEIRARWKTVYDDI